MTSVCSYWMSVTHSESYVSDNKDHITQKAHPLLSLISRLNFHVINFPQCRSVCVVWWGMRCSIQLWQQVWCSRSSSSSVLFIFKHSNHLCLITGYYLGLVCGSCIFTTRGHQISQTRLSVINQFVIVQIFLHIQFNTLAFAVSSSLSPHHLHLLYILIKVHTYWVILVFLRALMLFVCCHIY